jgi:hypothetical protein
LLGFKNTYEMVAPDRWNVYLRRGLAFYQRGVGRVRSRRSASERAAGVARRFANLGDRECKAALMTRSVCGQASFQGGALG